MLPSRSAMAELGYQEGRNFTFEYIQAPSIEGYELYRELAARKVVAMSRRCERVATCIDVGAHPASRQYSPAQPS